MPDAILEVMMLAMSKVFSITQGHLFTTVPKRESGKRKVNIKKQMICYYRARRFLSDYFM